ncbi:hypothetical protein [Sphaerisporangium aureirubrum]|uniref:DUF1273 domain-containing protein n=1 Tax=Sphaerisporangium aureirubrum TaxID=1544736 RepID=A0ABW1NHV5_9ACTN
MPKIAVTGHRDLTDATTESVRTAMREALTTRGDRLIGLSCLAEGADQLFAHEVVRAGGKLHAVIPAADYRDFLPVGARDAYDDLKDRAARVHKMPARSCAPESFMAASEFMLRGADELFAVWDGRPALGLGGTGDVVTYARRKGIKVHVIWPDGARRS